MPDTENTRIGPVACDWENLAGEMIATGRIRPERIKHRTLEVLHEQRRSAIILVPVNDVDDGGIVAHVARLSTLDPKWEELAMAFVRVGHTRKGLLGRVVNTLLKSAPEGLSYFAITRDAAMIKVLRHHRFEPITTMVDPGIMDWALAVGMPPNVRPETLHLPVRPDADGILAGAIADPDKAQRWLWRQMSNS